MHTTSKPVENKYLLMFSEQGYETVTRFKFLFLLLKFSSFIYLYIKSEGLYIQFDDCWLSYKSKKNQLANKSIQNFQNIIN